MASPHNIGFGKALLVEQCECPVGYSGLSCEVIHPFVSKLKPRCVLLQKIEWDFNTTHLVEKITYFLLIVVENERFECHNNIKGSCGFIVGQS